MLYCFLATKSRHSLQGHVRRQTGKPGPGTLVGPYKNRKTGTLAGPYKNRKTGTLVVPYENRELFIKASLLRYAK